MPGPVRVAGGAHSACGAHDARGGRSAIPARPETVIQLESGDLFVFGGPSRLAYHGVPRTLAGTGRPGSGLPSGRLNITLRESGLG